MSNHDYDGCHDQACDLCAAYDDGGFASKVRKNQDFGCKAPFRVDLEGVAADPQWANRWLQAEFLDHVFKVTGELAAPMDPDNNG